MLFRKRSFKLAADVEGFLTDREGQMLYNLALRCQGRGSIIEIGSEEHQTPGGKVWTFDDFKRNIGRAGLGDLVTPVVATSEKARKDINGPVELLFIDGAHDYDSVMLDYKLWAPLLVPGGCVAFHDTPWPGVHQATREIFSQGGLDRIYFSDTLMVARKAVKVTLRERWKNGAMLWANDRFQRACAGHGPRKLRSMDRAFAKFLRGAIYIL